MKDEFISRVGKWGRMHYDYLKHHSPTVINAMRLEGSLEHYITDFDRDTQEMYEHMIRLYVELEGVTEELKAEDSLEWIRRIDVYRDYELNIELNMNIRQFFLGTEEQESYPITA